jgi:hypothetical protein
MCEKPDCWNKYDLYYATPRKREKILQWKSPEARRQKTVLISTRNVETTLICFSGTASYPMSTRKDSPVNIGNESGWAPEPIWMRWWREISHHSLYNGNWMLMFSHEGDQGLMMTAPFRSDIWKCSNIYTSQLYMYI